MTHADVTLAGRDLGDAPSPSLEAGVAKFVEWFGASRDSLAAGGDPTTSEDGRRPGARLDRLIANGAFDSRIRR